MVLADLAKGTTASVLSVSAPDGVRRRLAELGVRVGAELTVGQRCAGGGRVVTVGNARLALDRRALQAVEVSGE